MSWSHSQQCPSLRLDMPKLILQFLSFGLYNISGDYSPQPCILFILYSLSESNIFFQSHNNSWMCRMKNVMWIGNRIIAIAALCLLYFSFSPQWALIALYCLLIPQQGCTAWKEFEGETAKEKTSACRFDFMRLHGLRSCIQIGKSRRRRKLSTGAELPTNLFGAIQLYQKRTSVIQLGVSDKSEPNDKF